MTTVDLLSLQDLKSDRNRVVGVLMDAQIANLSLRADYILRYSVNCGILSSDLLKIFWDAGIIR